MNLPQEILEKIFLYSSYHTLQIARQVHPKWKQIIEQIARKLCQRDISRSELIQYTLKWIGGCMSPIHWEQLYNNWYVWHDIESNISFTQSRFLQETDDISCISAFGSFVALGLSNGPVRIYNENGTLAKIYNILSDNDDEVLAVHFIADESFEPSELLVVYDDAIFIIDFWDLLAPGILEFELSYIKSFSAFDKYFSCITQDGYLTIAEVISDIPKAHKSYNILFQDRIYTEAQYVTKCTLSDDKCVLLINNVVKIIHFKRKNGDSSRPVVQFLNLQLAIDVEAVCRQYAWIYHNKIIITIYYFIERNEEICEIYVLDDKCQRNTVKSIKSFNIWNAINALIYAAYLYGSTLILGCSDGNVLFYNINEWEVFDVLKYSKRISLPSVCGPIRGIDVIETNGERSFYITGNKVVYKVVGKQI